MRSRSSYYFDPSKTVLSLNINITFTFTVFLACGISKEYLAIFTNKLRKYKDNKTNWKEGRENLTEKQNSD